MPMRFHYSAYSAASRIARDKAAVTSFRCSARRRSELARSRSAGTAHYGLLITHARVSSEHRFQGHFGADYRAHYHLILSHTQKSEDDGAIIDIISRSRRDYWRCRVSR